MVNLWRSKPLKPLNLAWRNSLKTILITLIFLFGYSQTMAALLSPRTYNKLNDIQESINEIADLNDKETINEINETLIELVEDLNGNALGMALTYQTHAQLKIKQEQYDEASKLLESAISQPDLDNATQLQLRLFLAQVYLSLEEYQKISELLEAAVNNKEYKISAPVYALLAASYYYLNDFNSGLPHIVKAIELSDKAKEPWLQMAFSGYYHQRSYARALTYSNLLVLNFPDKKDYWRQKAGMHQLIEDYQKAATTTDLTFKKGFIEKEGEFVNLAQLLATQGNPYKVAGLLESALKEGLIEENEKILNLLQQAWMQSKEVSKGRAVLAKLFEQFPTTQRGIRLLQLLADSEKWKEAILVSNTLYTLELTDKQRGKVLVLNGISQFNLGKSRQSMVTLSKAAAIASSSSQAKGWMSFIKQMSEG